MAITNSICLTQCNCKKISFTDTSDWDTVVPGTDVTLTTITFTNPEGVVLNEISEESYVDTYNFESTDNFPDGEYMIKIVYTADEVEYEIEEYFFNTCNIKCKLDSFILDLAKEEECTSCKADKLQTAVEAMILYKALCAVIICNNNTEAVKFLEWLEDKFVNYNCKNC